MYIEKIKISSFGPLVDKEFVPKDDIIIVSGDCEKPGQVVFDFIRSCLYGFHGTTGEERRKKYFPKASDKKTDIKINFGGELIFKVYGKTLRAVCSFGENSDHDYYELSDYELSRSIRMELNKTIGEYALKMSEGAFVSACFADLNGNYEKNSDGLYNLGKISSFLGINDGKSTINDVILSLNKKLEHLYSPKTKAGVLDKLIEKQFRVKSDMTRLSELDSKISAIKGKIEATEEQKAQIDEKLSSSEKVYLLANGAKLLLIKDKIMNVYNSMLLTMKQLDYRKSELTRLQNEKGFKHVYPGLMISFVGIMFIIASILFKGYETFSLVLLLVSILIIVAGVLVSLISFAHYLGRFKITVNGRVTTASSEVKRLEKELDEKNAEFISLIGDTGIVKLSKEWKKSEDILLNATESERRFAVLKSVEELSQSVNELRAEIEPIERELRLQKESRDNMLSVSSKAYAEYAKTLTGLDEKIKKLTNEAETLKIASVTAIETKQEFDNVILPMIMSHGGKIYRAITDDQGIFSVSQDYSLNVRLGVNMPREALLSVKTAICQSFATDLEKQIFVVSGKEDFNTLKDILRFSRISELIIER